MAQIRFPNRQRSARRREEEGRKKKIRITRARAIVGRNLSLKQRQNLQHDDDDDDDEEEENACGHLKWRHKRLGRDWGTRGTKTKGFPRVGVWT